MGPPGRRGGGGSGTAPGSRGILAAGMFPSARSAGQVVRVGWGLIVSKPAIVAVDDDPVVAAEITRDLATV